MKNDNEILQTLVAKVKELGASGAAVIPAADAVTDRSFRDACKQNSCGMYGRCWTCPPDAGDMDELIARVRSYHYMLLFETVGELEDSFDFEGMAEAKEKHNRIFPALRKEADAAGLSGALFLGAGGCGVCPVCAKRENKPCRHPEAALSSLEAYGVFVSKTAAVAGLPYINGQNTVTYFGAVLFDL